MVGLCDLRPFCWQERGHGGECDASESFEAGQAWYTSVLTCMRAITNDEAPALTPEALGLAVSVVLERLKKAEATLPQEWHTAIRTAMQKMTGEEGAIVDVDTFLLCFSVYSEQHGAPAVAWREGLPTEPGAWDYALQARVSREWSVYRGHLDHPDGSHWLVSPAEYARVHPIHWRAMKHMPAAKPPSPPS